MRRGVVGRGADETGAGAAACAPADAAPRRASPTATSAARVSVGVQRVTGNLREKGEAHGRGPCPAAGQYCPKTELNGEPSVVFPSWTSAFQPGVGLPNWSTRSNP